MKLFAIAFVMVAGCGGGGSHLGNDGGTGGDGAPTNPDPAVLHLAPDPIDFGETGIGRSIARTVMVSDTGGASGSIFASFEGRDASEFYIVQNRCTAVIAGAPCAVDLVFEPTASGSKTAKLVVSDGVGSVAIDVSGGGLHPAALTIDSTDYNFTGATLLATTSAETTTFTIRNTGGVDTGALNTAIGGASPDAFPIDDTCDGATLAPDGTCTVVVKFAPSDPRGAKSMAFTVTGAPGGTVGASVAGLALAPAQLSLSPAPFSFGFVPPGSAATQAFVVSNLGDVATGSVSTALSTSSFFKIPSGGDGCHQKILQPMGMANQSCTIFVQFAPGTSGFSGAMTSMLSVGANPGGSAASAISGSSSSSNKNLTITPGGDFGTVPTGTPTAPKRFTVTNLDTVTTGPLVTSLRRPNASDTEFVIVANTCVGSTLASNATCTLDIVFTPAIAGTIRTALLAVYSQNPVNLGVDPLGGIGN